ncbi:MAG TPA: type II secretion system F family protein [Kineosporiaceae bacterium]|nr:type II secretion system F family protein [Kineosporiaceae bacterium]
MSPLLAAVCGSSLVGGVLLVLTGLQRVPDEGRPVSRERPRLLAAALGDDLPPAQRQRRRVLLAVALGGGVVTWLLSGWALAVLLFPLLVVGVPALLRNPAAAADVSRLTAIEQWTRGMSGVLTVGSGIEHAIAASVGSTPPAIAPLVTTLSARLNARWPTEAALRAFADDLDDATGDLVAATLILGAHRRGPGLAAVLDDLAATVAEEVRIRRGIEADRAKPRTTARWVTILTLAVLGLLALNSQYIAPYKTPLGQVALAVFLALYVGCLVWMRAMTRGAATPRFLPAAHATRAPGGGR